ncbi:MAG: S49 family peptidase [Oscillochloridaceae bacterium umkhey_bin13]
MLTTFIIFFRNSWRRLINSWRRSARHPVGWVRLEIGGPLPELADEPPWWQRRFAGAQAPLSLQTLRRRLALIRDGKAQGVVLVIRGLEAGWATIESLHEVLAQYRASGGRIVAYLEGGGSRTYLAACAAEAIIMPPSATLNLLGLRVEATFLADTLRLAGIEAEVIAVSPYKSGGDQFARAQISPEAREQLERITEQRFTLLVETIATARKLRVDQVRGLIDAAPYPGPDAVTAGLLDATCYEDELEAWLRSWSTPPAEVSAPSAPSVAEPTTVAEVSAPSAPSVAEPTTVTMASLSDAPVSPAPDIQTKTPPLLLTWTQATRRLPRPLIRRERRYVGVVQVEGAISPGASRRSPLPVPLIGGEMAGAATIIQALRQVERNAQVAAVVVHVDSPGGDAFASDLIWREVLRLSQRKPLVVSMGDVAASGGYYIAAPARAIYARSTTLTGSIGVYTVRPNLAGLIQRAEVGTAVISRGANSGIFASSAPLTEAERATLTRGVATAYAEFKQRVRAGRKLSAEQLEPIVGGRVWSGSEALAHGLVDELGGFSGAVARARSLAELPPDPEAPLLVFRGAGKGTILPHPFPSEPPTPAPNEWLTLLYHELRQTRMLAALPWVLWEDGA